MTLSKNIVEIKINEDLLIYHKWYGNPIVVNSDNYELIKSTNNLLNIPSDFIEELITLGYLLRDENEEISNFKKHAEQNIKQALTGKKIKQLDLIVSESCNLGCPHCIYYAGNERKNDKNSAMNFTTALTSWEKYLATARCNQINNLEVHFGGAEPLVNWELTEKVLNEFPRYITDLESITWTMNTNVTLITEKIARKLKESNVIIHTSLDGNKEANDKIRMKLGGQGTFDLICEKIKLVRNEGIDISDLSTTITNENYDLISLEFINWLSDFGIKGFGIDIDLVNCTNVSTKQASEKITEIFWKCHELGIECSGTWMTPFLNIINKDLRTEHVAFCGAVKGQNISVTPKGELKLCPYMSTIVGNLENWDDMFLENSKFQNLLNERQPSADLNCRECILEGPCGGQCHITREDAKRNSNYNSYNLMCDFYREITTQMLKQYCNLTQTQTIHF